MPGGHGELDHLFHALWGILASAGLASVGVAYESPERRLELAFRYLASVCFGLLCFALIGFQILSGPSWRGLFGIPEAGLSGDFGTDVFIRHAAAVGLAAAVLTGALGSRPPFAGHMLLIFIQASILYPVVGHWMWATGADGAPAGWLGALGVVDRGGAAPVHVVAAAAAAAVAMRQGRDPDERSEAGGSRVALAASAVLLWIGWLGVSAVSPPGSPARSGDLVAAAANLSAAALFGAFVTYGLDTQAQRPCLLRALIRGGIAGLVAASAALTDVDLGGSALLGAGAGVVSQIVFRMRRVENPHGPIGVVEAHLVPALWGLVAVALLSRAEPMDVAQRWALLRAQTLAAGVTAAWSFTVTSVVVLLCERWLIRPRDRRSAELAGLEALRGSGGGALAPPSSAGSAAIAIEPSPASPELDPSDERARLIVENALDAVITMDARGRIIAWNAKAEEVFGWLRHEVVGRPATHVVVPETSRARLTKRITSLAAPGFPGASQEWTDLTLVRRSGVEFPAEMAVILLRRDDTHEYCAFVRDRGEMRRDADEKEAIGIISQLFLAADSLEGIYHELPNVLRTHFGFPIVAIETCDSVMLRMACVASTGLDAAALPLLRLPADMTLSGHVATTGRAVVDTQVARRPAHQLGILRDARVSALLCVPMKTRAEVFGTITVADTVARDIPSSVCESMQIIANYLAQTIIRRRTEDRLRGQRHEQQVIFDSVPAMIWYKDRENRILRANRPAAAAFGLDLGQLEGKTTAELFPANAIEHYREDLEVIRSGAPKFGLIEEIFLPTGQLRWLKMDKIPYVNADGEVIGVIVFAVDVTEQKRTERELAEARDMALESARLKSQFLANISHEIRTPLNGVIGMTELVLDSDIDAEQREHLGIALNSARSLLSLLTDILDFAKIEAGKLDLRSVAFDPRTAIAGLMKGLAAKAHEKRLELAFDVASDVPPLVAGDPDRLRQVILNLVDNAIKFTNEGEVVLRVDVESRDDEGFVLHVAVRDTGIGMDEDARARIFDAFWQADGTSTRRFGGTGLGLGIVSELVSRMGGRVWVDSRPGEGSTFHFTVRLAEAKTPEAPAELDRAPTLVGRRALVIVENGTTRGILQEMLDRWGIEVLTAATSKEGLGLTRLEGAVGRRIHFIVVDAERLTADSARFVADLKAESATRDATLLTLVGAAGSAAGSLELPDVAARLVKPVSQSDLLDALTAAQSPEGAPSATPDGPEIGVEPRGLAILLAEDNAVNQKLAVRILEKRGHRVTIANNGREAVDAFSSSPEAFDVVLMDVQMPELNGLEATDAIREREHSSGRRTPIIALTAHNMQGDRERCIEAGMDDYVSKPIESRALFAAIERAVEGFAPGASASAPVAPAPESVAPPPKSEPMSEPSSEPSSGEPRAPVFDVDDALIRTGGDVELLRELAELFLDEAAELLVSLRDAVDAGDAERVERAAHALKGSAANIGACGVRAAALRLEEIGRGGSLDGAAEALVTVEAAYSDLRPRLESYATDQAA